MKILHIGKYYPPIPGGIETHVKTLCDGLSKSSSITCAVSSHNKTRVEEEINGVKVVRFPKLVQNAPPINPSLLPFLRKHARDFDIVHLHMPNPWAELCCLFSRPKKLVVSYHADVVNKLGSSIHAVVQRAVLRRADAIIASTASMLETSPVLNRFKQKCAIIPYGIKAANNFDTEQATALTEHKRPLFLFVGRLVQYKGLQYLIRAMIQVQGTLLIIGRGPLLEELKSLMRKLSLQERVHFFTDVDDEALPSFYNSADIFVLPSINRSEAFGIVQLEAMAHGKPVISTSVGTGVESVNRHGKTGIIVPPSNVEELAKAMNKLAHDPKLRQRYGAAAKKRVQTEFTEDVMTERVLALYQHVIDS